MSAPTYDVAVIGGGPAGATAACRLARAGWRVVLFERDRFPRFHIGESLLASVNDVLEEIGADGLVRARGFPVLAERQLSKHPPRPRADVQLTVRGPVWMKPDATD
jgi:flavin-dependent dehydrogenase